MPRFKNIFILTAFVLWILPLGAFIKAADEKKVYDGQRAICLCSHMAKGKAEAKKILLVHSSTTEKETAPSGGSSGHFLTINFRHINPLLSADLVVRNASFYILTICKSIEHVPRA